MHMNLAADPNIPPSNLCLKYHETFGDVQIHELSLKNYNGIYNSYESGAILE